MAVGMSKKSRNYYINCAVSILIILAFHFAPTFSTLTRTGMDVPGIFIGVIYAFSTVDSIWPALRGIVLLGCTELYSMTEAFTAAFGSFGPKFIAVSILLFAYSTTLGWSHYGTKAVEYLFGTTGSHIYKVVFVCMTVVGATMKLGLAWDLSDTFNGLMMIPNLIGVLVLSGTVVDITRNYFDRRVKGKDIEPMWSAFLEYQKQEEAEAAAEEAELEKAANE